MRYFIDIFKHNIFISILDIIEQHKSGESGVIYTAQLRKIWTYS